MDNNIEKKIYFGSKDELDSSKLKHRIKFSDIATGFDYGVSAEAKEFDGENQYIRITDISDNGNFDKSKLSSPSKGLENKFLVHTNDILFARTGASVGKSYLYNPADGVLYFAGFLIRMNVSSLNSYYVKSYLQTNQYWKQVKLMSARSGQPGINSMEYKNFTLPNVTIEKSEKIGELLSSIDNLIQQQDDKIEQFTYSRSQFVKVHYGNTSERELIEFGHFLEEAKSPKASEIEIHKILRLGLHLKGLSTVTTNSTISLDKTNYYIRSQGDLIYGKQNIFNGSIAIIPEIYDGFLSSGDVPTLKFIGEKVNKYYFLEYLKQKRIYNKLEIYAIGTGSKRLHIPELLKLKFFIPAIEEQNKIACILSQMDNYIKSKTFWFLENQNILNFFLLTLNFRKFIIKLVST